MSDKKDKKKGTQVAAGASKKRDEWVTKGENIQQEVTLVRSQSSVVIKDDGKGKKAYEIKAYADTPEEAAELALKVMEELDKNINK